MVSLTPRADEYKPLVEVLESDAYGDAPSMAKALVKRAWELLSMRETHLLVIGHEGRAELVYGPFSSASQAEKLAKKIGGDARFDYSVVRAFPAGVLEANLDSLPGGGFGYCRVDECGHMQALHLMNGTARGGCSQPACSCERFRK